MGEEKPQRLPEPWLRGTHSHLRPIERAVLNSLELAQEDATKWCAALSDEEFAASRFGLPSPAAQLRHIAGTLDRFLTYAAAGSLSAEQLAALAREGEPASREAVLQEFSHGIERASRWLASHGRPLETPLKIGRKGLPATLGGLLVHMAEHTQRHTGQLVTTAKVALAQRARNPEIQPGC